MKEGAEGVRAYHSITVLLVVEPIAVIHIPYRVLLDTLAIALALLP